MDIQIYDPSNAKNLTEEQIAGLANLTIEEIRELAKAYPNKATGKAYLVLRDTRKKDKDQLFPRSTWQNFSNLLKQGAKHFAVISYVEIFSKKKVALKTAPLQDLTKKEAKAELKEAASQTAKEVVETGGSEVLETEAAIPAPVVKNYSKMNKEELQAEYKAKFESDPEDGMTKAALIEALTAN